jgi:hypothetical protein
MSIHQVHKSESERLSQGDIFKDVKFYESYQEYQGNFELNVLEIPYAIILTQDCDLEQNKNERKKLIGLSEEERRKAKLDKYLVSLLCAPLYNAEQLLVGTHLSNIGVNAEPYNSDNRKRIKQNNNIRYHYLEFTRDIILPPMIIDFKHYFSVNLFMLENSIKNRIYSVDSLFRESISHRFAHYLSRIGLPEITQME